MKKRKSEILKSVKKYVKHSFNYLPDMTEEEFGLLKNNIRQFGFDKNHSIILYEGKIIDGWQRYQASMEIIAEFIKQGKNFDIMIPTYESYPDMDDDGAIEMIKRNQIRRNQPMDVVIANFIESDAMMKRIQERVEADAKRKMSEKKKGNNNASSDHQPTLNSDSVDTEKEDKNANTTASQIANEIGGDATRNGVEKMLKLKKKNPGDFNKVIKEKKPVRKINAEKRGKAKALGIVESKNVTVPVQDSQTETKTFNVTEVAVKDIMPEIKPQVSNNEKQNMVDDSYLVPDIEIIGLVKKVRAEILEIEMNNPKDILDPDMIERIQKIKYDLGNQLTKELL